MAKVKINISLDEELMNRIDDYVEENYMNRSSFFTLTASNYLNAAEVTKAIKQMALSMRKIADSGEIDEATKRELEDFERFANFLAVK